MRNRMYGGVRGRKTRVGEKLHRFPPTRLPPIHALYVTNSVVIVWLLYGYCVVRTGKISDSLLMSKKSSTFAVNFKSYEESNIFSVDR